jgi:pyrimidine operon attenuation protein/uracil phosphoribosyltransferase
VAKWKHTPTNNVGSSTAKRVRAITNHVVQIAARLRGVPLEAIFTSRRDEEGRGIRPDVVGRGVPPSAKEVLEDHIAKREHREVKTAK